MILKAFCIYDAATQSYSAPLYFKTKGEALRSWVQAVNDKDLHFQQSPGDYTLFEIGEFDDKSGHFHMMEAKHSVGVATEFIRQSIQPVQEAKQ